MANESFQGNRQTDSTCRLLVRKAIWTLFAVVAAISVRANAGETYYLTTGGKYVLCDASGWSKEDGTAAGGAGDPLGSEDTFVIRGNKSLRTVNSNSASASQTFTGAKLQVGDLTQSGNNAKGKIYHYSGKDCVIDYGSRKLVLQYADYQFENAKKCHFSVCGDITIEGSASQKSCVCNYVGYNDQDVTWQGSLIGGSSAYLQVGVSTARTAEGDKSFRLIFTGATTDFAGTIDVVAPAPSDTAPDFHQVLGLAGTVSGTVNLTTQNAVLAIADQSLSVGTLVLADKSGLEFGDLSGLTVTTLYSSSGTVDLFFPDMSKIVTKDGAIHRIPLMTVPNGTNLDKDTFRIADAAMATVATLDVDQTGQGETLVLVQRALYANEFQLTSDANDKTLNLPENALANAYYWEDANGSRGAEHAALNPAAAYCLRQNRTLRTPNSNESSQSLTFEGGKL